MPEIDKMQLRDDNNFDRILALARLMKELLGKYICRLLKKL